MIEAFTTRGPRIVQTSLRKRTKVWEHLRSLSLAVCCPEKEKKNSSWRRDSTIELKTENETKVVLYLVRSKFKESHRVATESTDLQSQIPQLSESTKEESDGQVLLLPLQQPP